MVSGIQDEGYTFVDSGYRVFQNISFSGSDLSLGGECVGPIYSTKQGCQLVWCSPEDSVVLCRVTGYGAKPIKFLSLPLEEDDGDVHKYAWKNFHTCAHEVCL